MESSPGSCIPDYVIPDYVAEGGNANTKVNLKYIWIVKIEVKTEVYLGGNVYQ